MENPTLAPSQGTTATMARHGSIILFPRPHSFSSRPERSGQVLKDRRLSPLPNSGKQPSPNKLATRGKTVKKTSFELPSAGDGRHIVAAVLSQTICQLIVAGKTPAEAEKQALDAYNAILDNDPGERMRIWEALSEG